MKKRIHKTLWISLAAVILLLLAVAKLSPSAITSGDAPPSQEIAASQAMPVPAKPLFKDKAPEEVSTIVAEPPQANGVNGAPQILKNELGLSVSPLCFERFFNVDQPVKSLDITTCESLSGYQNIKTGLEDGRYQTTYNFPAEPDMPSETGISSYEMLGETPEGIAVQTYSETGGTGRFSTILLVQSEGNILTLNRQVTGGDRCNNGITEASVEDSVLTYSVNITPADFPVLAWGQDKGLAAYEDLEASAMSCFATATYKDGALHSIQLDPEAVQNPGDWSDQYTYQKCFNTEFKKAIDAGQAKMTPENFKSFMDSFSSACVGTKP